MRESSPPPPQLLQSARQALGILGRVLLVTGLGLFIGASVIGPSLLGLLPLDPHAAHTIALGPYLVLVPPPQDVVLQVPSYGFYVIVVGGLAIAASGELPSGRRSPTTPVSARPVADFEVRFSVKSDPERQLEVGISDGALADPVRLAGQLRALSDDLLKALARVPTFADSVPAIVPAVTAARDAAADPDVRAQLQRFLDALA